MSQPSLEYVSSLLRYDPETGRFWRLTSRGGRRAGSEAGHLQEFRPGQFYRMLRIDGRLFLASRVAWLLQTGSWPEHEIDHRDQDSTNDRWPNLRPATRRQNSYNIALRANNTSGLKGVSFDKFSGRWVARIRVPNGPYRNLGRYDTKEQAAEAYAHAAADFAGEFLRLR